MTIETINIADQEVRIDAEYLKFTFCGGIEIQEVQKLLRLKNLRQLNLSSSRLLDKHLEYIGKINSVELLDLDSTEITNQGLSFLQSLKKLKQLRLKDNPQLTDMCIEYLSNLESLELLHIESTSITINGLRRLLHQVKLKSIILGSEPGNMIEDLLLLSSMNPNLEITLKGVGIIFNGKLNQ
jgi:Leucine-rich repeat (LRR) protein